MCELTGQELYQSFAAVVVRGGCSSINTLMPCGGSLFKVTSESSECDTHDAVVGIRTRLQVKRDVSDKLRVWLPRDDVVNTFPIRGPGTVEFTRRVSLRNGKERVDVGKLVVTRKPQKRGSVAITGPSVPPICPNYFTILLSYSYTSSSVSIS